MKKRSILALISLILVSVMVFSLTACTSANAETVDLMEGITAKTVEGKDTDDTFKNAHISFSAELFKQSFDGENTLVSPLSVMLALGMTATGAEGETAKQFAELFGGIEADELNKYLKTYVKSLSSPKINIANSVWLDDREGFPVKEDFLQSVADYYAAEVFKSNLNVEEINKWVEKNTDGMIEKVLESLDPQTLMVLVNTILFEAEWKVKYEEHQIRDGEFTTKDGTQKKVSMMSSSEHGYLENELATGVMKPYEGGRYAFAALLPKEDVTIDELVQSLDGDKLTETLSNVSNERVVTKIPQFEYDFDIEMRGILQRMGLSDAFAPGAADFTGISENARKLLLHIGSVIHKTRIEVSPNGTKAAAATVVQIAPSSAAPLEPPKQVYLDRPFVYMIVDTETSLPVFIGAVTDIGE